MFWKCLKVSLMKFQSSDQCVGGTITGLQHNCEELKRMKIDATQEMW